MIKKPNQQRVHLSDIETFLIKSLQIKLKLISIADFVSVTSCLL
jgi:hypothetical protein